MLSCLLTLLARLVQNPRLRILEPIAQQKTHQAIAPQGMNQKYFETPRFVLPHARLPAPKVLIGILLAPIEARVSSTIDV